MTPTVDPSAVFEALRAFADAGAGFWRIKQVRVPALCELPVVRDQIEKLQLSEADAVEHALELAVRTIEPPHREAASAHLGLTDGTRVLSARTRREDVAARALSMDPRTYRRTDTPRDARSQSYADQVMWMVADALLDGPPHLDARPRILYVEDDPMFVEIVRQALPDFALEAASDLGEALRILEASGAEFSLVLVDANLTNRDDHAGYEVLEYLLEKRPELPRILITASRMTGPLRNNFFERYGLSELLLKDHEMLPGLRASVTAALKGR